MKGAEFYLDLDKTLKAEKGTLDAQLQSIKTLVMPNKDEVTQKGQTPGQKNDARTQFDPTAPQANELLAASMAGSLTPQTSQWFDMKFRDDDLNDIKEIADWMQDNSRRMFKAYLSSNFYTKIHESFLDLGGFGTTAVIQEEKPRDANGNFTGVKFDVFPISDYTFLEGSDGLVNTLFREHNLTADQVHDRFSWHPKYKGLGEKMEAARNSDKAADKAKRFKILQVITPSENRIPGLAAELQMETDSKYFSCDDKHEIITLGYNEFPCAVARWSKLSADNGWGRGPGWTALPTIKRLNRIHEQGLKALAKDVSPPLLVPHKGVVGGMRTNPNGITYYDARKYGGAKPEYMNSGSRWDIAQFNIESMEQKIRQMFYSDQLEMQEGPQMTAMEVQVRYELMQRLLGPTFWRLVTELFSPTLNRTFNIMLRAGAFQDIPEVLMDMINQGNAPELDIVYTGPLARAQRQEEVVAIQRGYELAGFIAETKGDPSVLDNLDDDEAFKHGAEQLGVPGKVLRGKDQVAERRQARQEQIAQQQQLEQADIAAGIADKAATAEQKLA